jgi:hypothetical protein
MSGGVFLRRGDELIEMAEQPYELEDHLQELVEQHPNLLARDQVDPDAPRRWLLLSREAAVPAEEGAAGRWSLDHLLLDQDAIPTLVEVKRSSNREIRRLVVGQMLDYAANAVTYWNVDTLRAAYEVSAVERGGNAEDEIAELVDDPELDYDEFWERAKTNLRAGRIRLVFVADTIPTELQRIVEFLNERMSPTQVLAVEIRQYRGGGEQTLVPRVLGQTAEARQRRASSSGRGARPWDAESFLAATTQATGEADAEVARRILDWAETAYSRIDWGNGARGRFTPGLDHGGRSYYPMHVWTTGKVAFQFYWMKGWPPFDTDDKRLELLRKLNEIPGIDFPENAIAQKPSTRLEIFRDDRNLQTLLSVLEWFAAEARSS